MPRISLGKVNFHNHMIETDEAQIKRVSDKIQSILVDEGLVFDVDMIPQIRIRRIPQPVVVNEPVKEPENEDTAAKS